MMAKAGALIAVLLLMLAYPAKAVATAAHLSASPGWQLEYFGQDVVILKTALAGRSGRRTGLIMLSCDAAERRLRIILPERATGLGAGVVDGSALIRAAGPAGRGQPAIVARFSIQDERMLTFAGTGAGNGDFALRLARLLRAGPPRLDILLHGGRAPIALGRVLPYTVSLVLDGRDSIGFDGFVSVCTGRS